MEIREATVEDAETLAAIEREVARRPGRLVSRPEELKSSAYVQMIARLKHHPRGRYLVAWEGDEIVGHCLMDPMELAAVSHIVQLTIVVKESFQGKGVGRALLTEGIRWARHNPQVGKIELRVRVTNEVAIALYRKVGFLEEGRLSRRVRLPDGNFIDDLAMALWVEATVPRPCNRPPARP